MNRFVTKLVTAGILASAAVIANASSQDTHKNVIIRIAPNCNIRVTVPSNAMVTGNQDNRGSGSITVENPHAIKSKEYIEPFHMGFICYPEDDEQTTFPVVRFNTDKKQWTKDASEWEKEAVEAADPEHRKFLRKLIKTTVVHNLQAVNRQGWAMTQEDLTGDESARRRTLHYCLINPPKALCGYSDVGYLKDGRKGDLTDYALKILRSIEFLPEEPAADGGTAPAARESGGAK